MSSLSTKLSTDFVEMFFYQNGLTQDYFIHYKKANFKLILIKTFEIPFPL